MNRLPIPLRVAPLLCCCLFIAAAEDDCTIRIVTGEEEECVDLAEYCPALDCGDLGHKVDDDGCALCECNEPGEGEGEGECQSDADCRDGQFCAFFEECGQCDPAAGEQCIVACELRGVCQDISSCDDDSQAICDMVPPECGPGTILAVQNGCYACVDPFTCLPPDDICAQIDCPPELCFIDDNGNVGCGEPPRGCLSDADCADGELCVFDAGEPGGTGDRPIAAEGRCEPILIGCENVLCADGTHCEVSADGTVQCVPNESECASDADCGEGGRCEVTCQSDPSCPECDVCLIVGICIFDEPQPVPECTSDVDCTNGEVCNAADVCLPGPGCNDPDAVCDAVCWGTCEAKSCFEDSECAEGQVCIVEQTCPGCSDSDPACLAPCYVEGHCANADGSAP